MPVELTARLGQLQQRALDQAHDFRRELRLVETDLRMDWEQAGDQFIFGLRGNACEWVERNRGGRVAVVPICDLPNDLKAWLGFRETWSNDLSKHGLTFRDSSLTVFFGKQADPLKLQGFRMEWNGYRNWTGAGASFHSAGAGHPHWQFDLLESLRQAKQMVTFSEEAEVLVEEFDDTPEVSVADTVSSLTFDRMHLASGAAWWQGREAPQIGRHMNAPGTLQALKSWANEALAYIRQELQRCEVKRRL